MKLLTARFGKYLHAALAGPVELCGEWILVYANFADRLLGREPSASIPIYKELPAVRAGSRPGKGLKIRGEIVAIVRQRVQIGFLQN